MNEAIILSPEQHFTLGAEQFGMEGLVAVESIGPFTDIQACGPLITVHDSIIYAGQGIGHHPHRFNERLFYLEQGTFDHDDALNNIQGHIPDGAMARFTEGQRGMIHKEWNNGEQDAHIFILVATTDPVPEDTSFEVLEQQDMPEVDEAEGVRTRYMVGEGAPLPIYSDIHTFSDTSFEPGSELTWQIEAGSGGLLSVRSGSMRFGDEEIGEKYTVLLPPQEESRSIGVSSPRSGRIIRTTFGSGLGLVRRPSS